MTGGAKVALALGVVAVGAFGVAIGIAAASPYPVPANPPKPVTPPPMPGPVLPPPPTPTGAWISAPAQINPGTRVRVSVAPGDLGVLAQSIGTTADLNGWKDLLANPVVQSAIQASLVTVWGPDASGAMNPGPLPSNWPTDDPSPATEYHAEFVYGGASPLVLSDFPVPVLAWVQAH